MKSNLVRGRVATPSPRQNGSILAATILLATSSLLCGCTGSAALRATAAGKQHLAAQEYPLAQASFEQAASMSKNPRERARAQVGVSRANLAQGRPAVAKRILRKAQASRPDAALAAEIHHLMGIAFMAEGNWNRAYRYLDTAFEATHGPQREELLARLSLARRMAGDSTQARTYEAQLSRPHSPEVAAILAGHDPYLMAASESAAADRLAFSARYPSHRHTTPESTLGAAPPTANPEGRTHRYARPGKRLAPQRIRSRNEWGARATRGNVTRMGRVQRITVHHTANDNEWDTRPHVVAKNILKIQQYHQKENGWADIGYHFVVDRAGRIWEGRPVVHQGAHAGGSNNRGNVGVVVLGDYTKRTVNSVQRASLENLLVRLRTHYRIPPSRIYTHKEFGSQTACPGPALQRCVDGIRASLVRGRGGLARKVGD